MTLEQILELAEQARRSPHARLVLHDALLERYGDAYEEYLAGTQRRADTFGHSRAILLDVDKIVRVATSAGLWLALFNYPILDLHAARRRWEIERQTVGGTRPNEVLVTVVRPR